MRTEVAGFEVRERGSRAQESGRPLAAVKGKETDFLLNRFPRRECLLPPSPSFPSEIWVGLLIYRTVK